jgi:hypothetical protein
MLTFKTVSLHFVMFGPFPFLGRIVHIPTTEFGKLHFTWCIACSIKHATGTYYPDMLFITNNGQILGKQNVKTHQDRLTVILLQTTTIQ